MSETYGYFSRASPDETQYLPQIKPPFDKRNLSNEYHLLKKQDHSDLEESNQKHSQLPNTSS